jgi:hypothetical protein
MVFFLTLCLPPLASFSVFGFGFVYKDGQLRKYVLFMLCVSRVAVRTDF